MPESAFDDNPYAAPRAAVADVDERPGRVRLFSTRGRIGRLRYLCWWSVSSMAISATGYVLVMLLAIIGAIVVGRSHVRGMTALFIGLIVLVVVAAVVAQWGLFILLTIQRSHDMDWTGWTSLICLFVPFAAFVWIFKPGTRDANLYGAPPPPTPLGVKITGIGLPVLGTALLIAIVAAVVASSADLP